MKRLTDKERERQEREREREIYIRRERERKRERGVVLKKCGFHGKREKEEKKIELEIGVD